MEIVILLLLVLAGAPLIVEITDIALAAVFVIGFMAICGWAFNSLSNHQHVSTIETPPAQTTTINK